MRTPLTLLLAGVLASPAATQVLNEQFNYSTTGNWPPTGWTAVDNAMLGGPGWWEPSISPSSIDWLVMTFDAAGHDDYLNGFSNDASLHTPNLSFGSLSTPQLTFDEDLAWVNYMLHYPGTFGNGESFIKVSTDGGSSWTTEWTETVTTNGLTPGVMVDLVSYAGQPSVDLQFQYVGDWAHCWAIDNVVVDNGGNPVGPTLVISGNCPGPGSADCSGMTPGGPVGFYYSLTPGSLTLPSGACAGMTLPVLNPTQLGGFVGADANGNISLPGTMQPNHCGNVIVGAVDILTCTPTNTVTL